MNGNFRQRMMRFMSGRYGYDQLSRFYLGLAAVCMVLYLFFRAPLIYLAGLVLTAYSLYRSFSRNTAKMSVQNQKYLDWRCGRSVKLDRARRRWAQRRAYRIYKCPGCRQKVRVPRGRGRIAITCPKCQTEFIKKS